MAKMLLIFTCVTLVHETLCGPIVDLNCTYMSFDAANAKYEAKFSEKAVNCPNVLSDSVCSKLYDVREAKVDDANDRDDKCYKAADPSFKEAAISNCPKRCGYCCLTPEYNCPNSQFPRISCSVITPNMCYSSAWRNIIEEDCPSVCGFCNSGNCFDVAPNCAKDISICRSIFMQDFVKENCKRTCGYCSQTGATTAAPCGSDPNCVNWVRNGFCNSIFYTQEQKRQYCGRFCGLC
ncbi:hypothetical protein RB195_003524 [Necator americanus]|uniref:ShKT domain-containing protein n=2 Tax=Necator americanus TaxID=51031 RepID=A0ABR1DP00_NECAM